jgi:crotonobetainyl-CoA:carnitine CoA-transferase CaiB-like acyl-CoA transferase
MHTGEHLHDRGYFTPITHPAAGTHVHPGPPGKLAHSADVPPFRPAPTPGEHNQYVFKELLGLSDQQYQALIDDQIIGTVYLETAHP